MTGLNAHQQAYVDTHGKGANVVFAGAGSGKTKTFVDLVIDMIQIGIDPGKILAVTFTTKAAAEMRVRIAQAVWPSITQRELDFWKDPKKFQDENDNPLNDQMDRVWIEKDPVRKFLADWVCTIHAMSFRLLKINNPRLKTTKINNEFDLSNIVKDGMAEFKWVQDPKTVEWYINFAINELVDHTRRDLPEYFMDLIARRTPGYFPPDIKEDVPYHLAEIYSRYMRYLRNHNMVNFSLMQADLLRAMRRDPSFRTNIQSMFEYVLVDEGQDTNDMQTEILWTIAEMYGNISYIGDTRQCVIDSTPIKVYNVSSGNTLNGDTMIASDIKIGDTIVAGGGNGIAVPAKVTSLYKHYVFEKPVYRVKTLSGKELTTTGEHIYFAEFDVDSEKHYTYLMYKEGVGFRIGVTKSKRYSGTGGIHGFKSRLSQEVGDKIWVLEVCDTESQARYFEELYSKRYGITTWVFLNKPGMSLAYSQRDIERIHYDLDTYSRGMQLLSDFEYDFERPHHTPRSMSKRRRRNFSIIMCGATNKSGLPLHNYQLSGSEDSDKAIIESSGIYTRKDKIRSRTGSRGWRINNTLASLGDVYAVLDKVKSVMGVSVIEAAKLTNRSFRFCPASQLKPSMKVFVDSGNSVIEDTIVSVERTLYSGYVYDFNVDRFHNYCAGGIFVHNSIYAWNGAKPELMMQGFDLKWKTVNHYPFPTNYRSTKIIVDVSNRLIELNFQGDRAKYLTPAAARDDAADGVDPEYEEYTEFGLMADAMVERILDDGNFGDWFIISRTRAECAAIHTEFVRAGVSAINLSGGNLFGASHIRKVMAYAKLACNWHDSRNNPDVLKEVANVASSKFMAPMTRRNHIDGCPSKEKFWIPCGCPVIQREGIDRSYTRFYGEKSIDAAGGKWRGIEAQMYERKAGKPSLASNGATDLVEFVRELEDLKGDALAALMRIIDDSVLPWMIHEKGEDTSDPGEEGGMEEFDLLLEMVKDGMTLEQFIDDAEIILSKGSAATEEESVLIMTGHKSKGAERPKVMANLTRCPIMPPKRKEGQLPTTFPPTMQEERNLAYVMITRAKEQLVVYSSLKWNGQSVPRSPFISEMGFCFDEPVDDDEGDFDAGSSLDIPDSDQ